MHTDAERESSIEKEELVFVLFTVVLRHLITRFAEDFDRLLDDRAGDVL